MKTKSPLTLLFHITLATRLFCQTPVVDVFEAMSTTKRTDLSEISQQLTYSPLSTVNQTILIGRIGLLAANKHYNIIYDDLTHRILLYDSAGQFKRTLMSYGKGPNEFIGINSLDINNNNEILVLYNSNKVTMITPDANSTGNFYIKGSSPVVRWLNNEIIVIFYPYPYFINNGGFEISFVDRKGKVIKNILPQVTKQINYNDMVPRFNCSRGGGSLYYWNSYRDTVYTITPQFEIKPRIILKHGRNRFSINLLKKGAEGNGVYNPDLGYIQTSYREFGELSLIGISDKRKRVSLVVNCNNGQGGNILYEYTENHNRGFKNDVDGGCEFWPIFESFEGDLIMYSDPNNFREEFIKNQLTKSIISSPNQREWLKKEVVDKISLMDNPILIKLEK